MPSKKPNKAAKKPGKGRAPKKATRKAAAPKEGAQAAGESKSPPPNPGTVTGKAGRQVRSRNPRRPSRPLPQARYAQNHPRRSPRPSRSRRPARRVRPNGKPAPIKFDTRPLVLPDAACRSTTRPRASRAASASLLAGPRNVKPYIARRGEQYMNKEQLEHFARILQNWKRDLMVEVDRTVLHMKDEAANFPDPNDRATQEEEFSLELRTRDRERKLIRKIDEALKRIEDGSYGYCLETGEEIGIKRLEARPVATLSVEAQERRERREKQYGDRDDRYR